MRSGNNEREMCFTQIHHDNGEIINFKDILNWKDESKIIQANKAIFNPEYRYPLNDFINSKISFWIKGNIEQLDIDAIFYTTNSRLLPYSALSNKIFQIGGKEMETACSTMIPVQSTCNVITPGFGLPSRYVIHAVAPDQKDEKLLKNCYENILARINGNTIKSIALICMGSGNLGFSTDLASSIALRVVREFLDNPKNLNMTERIVFVLYNQNDINSYLKNVPSYFPICSEKPTNNETNLGQNQSPDSIDYHNYDPFVSLEGHISYAFTSNIPTIDIIQNCIILDLFDTPIIEFCIQDCMNLTKVRLSHCHSLQRIEINQGSNLEALDASDCPQLGILNLSNIPRLKALDLSFCSNLNEIVGDLSSVEYFSIVGAGIINMPLLPNVKFLDISECPISDLSRLSSCTKLQSFVYCHRKLLNFDIKPLMGLKYLSSIHSSCSFIDLYSLQSIKSLRNIYLPNCSISENLSFPLSYSALIGSKMFGHQFLIPILTGDWHNSHRLLYGPWPSPPNDYCPQFFPSEHFLPPKSIDMGIASDLISGVVFGCGIGDCVGLHTEREPVFYINAVLDNPIDITWTHPRITKIGMSFHRGTFTDDTALSLMFMRSVCCNNGNINVQDMGKRIHSWIENGLEEHNDGYGIGQGPSTARAVYQDSYDDNPIEKSLLAWIETGSYSAGSGAVMRTGPVGCYMFWSESDVIRNAKQFALLTHPHPLCVYGSVVISLLISRCIQFRCGLIPEFDIDQTILDVIPLIEGLTNDHKKILSIFTTAEELGQLDIESQVHHPTLITMGCGIWSFRVNLSFSECLTAIIRAGGDTDTNGAVVGACLGAKYGYSGIPKHLIHYFWYKWSLRRELIPFLDLMGMTFDPYCDNTYPMLIRTLKKNESCRI